MWPTYFIPNTAQAGYYLTSMPYPVEVIEAMTSVSAILRGWSSFGEFESLESVPSFVEATRRELLIQTDVLPEALDSTASFLSGTWRELLIRTSVPPDSLESTAAFLSGTIDTVLIQYSNWPPEPLVSSASFLGGTRT